jgi:hypothetical protein
MHKAPPPPLRLLSAERNLLLDFLSLTFYNRVHVRERKRILLVEFSISGTFEKCVYDSFLHLFCCHRFSKPSPRQAVFMIFLILFYRKMLSPMSFTTCHFSSNIFVSSQQCISRRVCVCEMSY